MNAKRSKKRTVKKTVRKSNALSNNSVVQVKKMIKREVAKGVESKSRVDYNAAYSFYYPAQGALYNSANTIQVSAGSTSLPIVQGTSDGARIGNEITVKKCNLDMVFYPTRYDASTNPNPEPLVVTLVLFYDKRIPTTFPTPVTDFYQFNSTTDSISGDLTDNIAPYNLDCYRIMATKTFKLGYSAYTGSSSDPIPQYYTNNDYHLNQIVKWDITKYLVKTIKYNDNNSDPTSRGLWLQVLISPADGSMGAAGVIPAKVSYCHTLYYEDA